MEVYPAGQGLHLVTILAANAQRSAGLAEENGMDSPLIALQDLLAAHLPELDLLGALCLASHLTVLHRAWAPS